MKKYINSFLFSTLVVFSLNATNPDSIAQALNPNPDKAQQEISQAEMLKELSIRLQNLQDQIKNLNHIEVKIIQEKPASPQAKKAQGKIASIFCTIGDTYKFIIEKSDKLTSKKAIIGLVVIAGPFILLLYKCGLGGFVDRLFSKTTDVTLQVTGKVTTSVTEGILNGSIEFAKNHPKEAAVLTAYKTKNYWLKPMFTFLGGAAFASGKFLFNYVYNSLDQFATEAFETVGNSL